MSVATESAPTKKYHVSLWNYPAKQIEVDGVNEAMPMPIFKYLYNEVGKCIGSMWIMQNEALETIHADTSFDDLIDKHLAEVQA